MRIGNIVTGTYCDVVITGMVTAFDGSGYVYVRPSKTTEILGSVRDEVCFDRFAKKSLKVVAAGPVIDEADLVRLPYDCVGGDSIRRASIAKYV